MIELIKCLQHQGDEYTRKIETGKRIIANLQSHLLILHVKVEQQHTNGWYRWCRKKNNKKYRDV